MDGRGFLLLLLLDFPSSVPANVLRIEERPDSGVIVAIEKSTLKLTCLVPTSQILNTIYWFIPGRSDIHVTNTNVLQSPYIQVEQTNSPKLLLFVRDFQSRDQGTYSCRFYDRSDASSRRLVAEETVTVTMATGIHVVTADPEQWLRQGSDRADIRCQIEGDPPPTIVWMKGSKRLETNDKYSYQKTGLQVSRVTWDDAGKYVCRAQRSGTSTALDIFIDVKVFETPRITQAPTVVFPLVMTAGIKAMLECKATGNPPPKIFWFKKKDGNQEIVTVDPQRYFSNPYTGQLGITNVDFEKDSDTYICVAALTSQAVKQNVRDMMASVEKFIQVFLWPSFFHVDRPLHQNVDLGKTVTIRCSVRANGNIQLQFQKYGAPYPYVTGGVQTEDPRVTVTKTQDSVQPLHHYLTLTIVDTVSEDSSNYTCIATNLAGNSSVNGTVMVEHRPWMANLSEIHRGWIRNGTNLTCIAYGLPHPTWTWLRHGLVGVLTDVNKTFHIFSYDYDRSSQSWLQIRPDFGMERWIFDSYTCIANNRKGEGRREVQFDPAYVPGTPKLANISLSSSSINLEVGPPTTDGGMSILHYEVQYRALGGPQQSWYGPVRFPVNFSLALTGLLADTEYTLEVRARNLVGLSQFPMIIRRRTLALVPPSKVEVISPPVSTYPYTYYLRWKVPHNGGEPLDGYRIKIRRVGSSGEWRTYRPLFDNPYLSGYFLIDLEADTEYDLRIQAHSANGYGPEGHFRFRTPWADSLGKPDRVQGGGATLQSSWFLFLLWAIWQLRQ